MFAKLLLLALIIGLCSSVCAADKLLFSSFYRLFDIVPRDSTNNGTNITKSVEEMTVDELGVSRGECLYEFIPFVSYENTIMCYADDEYILHMLPSETSTEQQRKPPIMVKCMKEHPLTVNTTNELHVMTSVQDIIDLLKPIGNNTRRYQPGSCVLVYFYTPSCIGCQLFAVTTVELPHAFKTIPVAAIDAYKFPRFNTEFGIVALPTLMLFHQGRPVDKYRGLYPKHTFTTFVTRHTGLKPVEVPKIAGAYALLGFTNETPTDYVLVLAWLFILTCAGYYFSQSQLCKQIVEMIKRNWRESEAQLEHN